MVDLWSLGVCLFEFMCGYLPFGDDAEGPYEIYDDIMRNELKFPDFIKDKKAKKLMEQLLSHNPDLRHGGSFAALKTNPWFEGFDWQDLLNRNDKKLEPPYIPDIKNKLIELHGQIARAKMPLPEKIRVIYSLYAGI
jgi:cGMP-dependent protein kinase